MVAMKLWTIFGNVLGGKISVERLTKSFKLHFKSCGHKFIPMDVVRKFVIWNYRHYFHSPMGFD